MAAQRTLMLHHLRTADDVLKSRFWVLRFAASLVDLPGSLQASKTGGF